MVFELDGIEKSFPGVYALKGVGLSVTPGTVHALLGENGAGKSTLIKVASGALQPDAGTISVDGVVRSLTPQVARELGIRVLHQERQIAATRTVADNVLLDRPARNRFGFTTAAAANREAAKRMERVGVDLDPRAPAWSLSVAQLQLLELARAVDDGVRILIMDEPTASLHRGEVQGLFDVVRQVRDTGVAVVYISHHLDEVLEVADEYTVLRDGSRVATGQMQGVTMPVLIRHIFGEDMHMTREEVFAGTQVEAGDTLVELRDAALGTAVLPVSLELRRGEVVVLTGAVGGGSQELAKLISGAVRPTSGEVIIKGRPSLSRRAATRAGVAYLPADRKRQGLMLDRSVADNTLLAEGSGRALTGTTYRRDNPKATAACTRLGVKVGDVRTAVRGLSGGNQQKSILARWMNMASDVIVLDEPTAGIDIPSKIEIYRDLRRSAAQGMAVVVVSTEYQEIRCVADRVFVMRDGAVVGELAGDTATEHRLFELEFGARP
jgi:ABC-type sugar transport system ATPase subunit